jgi:peptidoglycan/xylan/chitin deacetylase (PgdA/CDA1 family)
MAGRVMHRAGVFRFLHGRMLPGNVSVITYHGLIGAPLPIRDGCFLHVSNFRQQMEYLSKNFEMLHVEEALAWSNRRTNRPLACVTFDDGFESVHNLAFPILKQLNIPATVYLVTDLVDSDETLWFARLHQAICETSLRSLEFGGRSHSLADRAACAQASIDLQIDLKRLPRTEFEPALEHVLALLGVTPKNRSVIWEPFRILSSDKIRSMSKDGLVRFGAHTASHQILTRTTPEDAEREIERSVTRVAALVDEPSRSFAYPNGGAQDFDVNAMEAVRRAGLDYAFSLIPGPVDHTSNRYAIPRYHISDDDPLARFGGLVHHTRATVQRIVNLAKRSHNAINP